MNEFDISEKSIDSIRKIFSNFPSIEKVIVYGSRAKGNYKSNSDIDMTIIVSENFDFSTLARVNTLFYDSSLSYLYDIFDFSKLTNKDLIEHIERCGKIIYRRLGC